MSYTKCSVGSLERMRWEQYEFTLIEANITVNPDMRRVMFKYPTIEDLNKLADNRLQAIAESRNLETNLRRRSELEAYNSKLREFIDRRVLHEFSNKELKEWNGPNKYISHNGFVKPGSVTTKLRVVSNSSLDNNNSRLSFNDCLPKGHKT